MLLDDWPIHKYLAPVSTNEFEPLSDLGRIVFDTDATTLTWSFEDGSTAVYRRA